MDSFDTLVIILSATLAIFLILSIVFMIFLIKIAKHVDELTQKAQSVVNNVETASKIFEKTAGPVAVTKIVSNIIDMFKENNKRKK